MKRLSIALFCLAGLISAQTATPPPEGEEHQWLQEVIDVRYADANALAKLLGNLAYGSSNGLLSRSIATAHPDLHAISIGTHDPSFLKLAKEIVKRYDVPRAGPDLSHAHGVEILAHILLAGPKGSSGDALPASLEPVVKQLRSVFGYTDIRLLDSALILGREARGVEVSGTLSGLIDALKLEGLKTPSIYRLRVKSISVDQSAKGNSVLLEEFRFSARVPYPIGPAGTGVQYQFMDLGFDTDLNVLEGQKVVVGKTHIGETKEAMILVLSARVVE
jgi:hypothetical protein